jgi:hypothetical protein
MLYSIVAASKYCRLAEEKKKAIEQEKNTGTIQIIFLFKQKALWLSTVDWLPSSPPLAIASLWNMARKIASLILSEDGENSADHHKT